MLAFEKLLRKTPQVRETKKEKPLDEDGIEAIIQKKVGSYRPESADSPARLNKLREAADEVAAQLGLTEGLIKFLNARLLIRKRLGKGAFGEVYQADHLLMGRDVALKVLRPPRGQKFDEHRRARFHREVQSLARLDHPNVGKIYNAYVDDETAAFFGELIKGKSLEDYLEQLHREAQFIPIERAGNGLDAVEIMKQITEGLSAIHHIGLIFRDLKPDNIMIADADAVATRKQRVKIIDFGLVDSEEALKEADAQDPLTDEPAEKMRFKPVTGENMWVGTVGYLSPEQMWGEPLTPASDVFSLGVTFYKLLTGEKPFHGTLREIRGQAEKGSFIDPQEIRPAIPDELNDLIVDMLSDQPEDRPTLGEIQRVLGHLEDKK